MDTLLAIVRNGRIETLENSELPERRKVLVTLLPDDGDGFWQQASQTALKSVWDNPEDDVYAKLLSE